MGSLIKKVLHMNYEILNNQRCMLTYLKSQTALNYWLLNKLSPGKSAKEIAEEYEQSLSIFAPPQPPRENHGCLATLDEIDTNMTLGQQSWKEMMQTGDWDRKQDILSSLHDNKLSYLCIDGEHTINTFYCILCLFFVCFVC